MVLFLDSGIGGLPYCGRFMSRNPGRGVLYFADREHFPYGSKTREELASLLVSRVSALAERFPLDIAVLACNTASVSALAVLRRRFPSLPFVGTVPAIKPALEANPRGTAGVLGTERTVSDPYIDELAARYGKARRIVKIAAPELVEFVERALGGADAAERRRRAASYVERFRAAGADGIVLGCTHFVFLAEEFRAAARPDIAVFDSVEGVVSRAESLLRGAPDGGGGVLLAAVPEDADGFWAGKAAEYGLELRLWGRGP